MEAFRDGSLNEELCREAVEYAEYMPTDAVIDLIKEGYRQFPFLDPELRPSFQKVLDDLGKVVESRQGFANEPPSLWDQNAS